MEERRKSKRVDVSLKASFTTGGRTLEGETADISATGFYVRSPELLPVGSMLSFRLSHEELGGDFEVVAQVMHTIDEHAKKGRGMGVMIRKILTGQDERFDAYRMMIHRRLYA